jgi:hypothetical protein
MIVPGMSIAQLAVTSSKLSDDLIQLIRVIGQVAEKQGEPKILDWLTPYIMACSGDLDTLQEALRAIVEEQPARTEEPGHGRA